MNGDTDTGALSTVIRGNVACTVSLEEATKSGQT
jgi:hypothetical protein